MSGIRRSQARTPATAEVMRQLRGAILQAMRDLTLVQAADLARCSPNTLCRIIRGENVSIYTAARIVDNLGATLTIGLAPKKTQHVVVRQAKDLRP